MEFFIRFLQEFIYSLEEIFWGGFTEFHRVQGPLAPILDKSYEH